MQRYKIIDLLLVVILTVTVGVAWPQRIKIVKPASAPVIVRQKIPVPKQQQRKVVIVRAKVPRKKTMIAAHTSVLKYQKGAKPSTTTLNILIVGHNRRLADSIILAAINRQARKITLISIPRDLYVKERKINEYLSVAGSEVLKDRLEEVLGLELHKYVVFDFMAFETIIDVLGGVDIYVEKPLYDIHFPNNEGSYEILNIETGAHHMNGVEALAYVRSRHSTSDFDRTRRQQQILNSVHERVINFEFLKNHDALRSIYDTLSKSIETTVSFLDLVGYLKDFSDFRIESGNVLSTSNLLYSTRNKAGQYILLPKEGNFEPVKKYVREMLFG